MTNCLCERNRTVRTDEKTRPHSSGRSLDKEILAYVAVAGQSRCRLPGIFPNFSLQHCLREWPQEYAVIGSKTVTTSLTLVIGKPASRECSRTRSSLSAR